MRPWRSAPPTSCSVPRVVHRAYRGREPHRAILGAVLTVFSEFRYVTEFTGDGGHVLEFTALIGDREVQGIDLLRTDADRHLRELTVMVRPLSAAEALRDRMAPLLDDWTEPFGTAPGSSPRGPAVVRRRRPAARPAPGRCPGRPADGARRVVARRWPLLDEAIGSPVYADRPRQDGTSGGRSRPERSRTDARPR